MKDEDKTKKQLIKELKQHIAELEISENKHQLLEDFLKKKTEELDIILTNLKQGIAYLDVNDEIIYINKHCSDLFGLRYKDVIGKNIYEFHIPEVKRKVKTLSNKFRKGKQSLHLIETVNGRFIDNTFYRIQDADGNYKGILMSALDITERRKMEQELEVRARTLNEVNTALRVLLKRRDEDKTELEEKVLLNVKKLVVPYLEKLKKERLNKEQIITYVSILESNINDIISPFSRTMAFKYPKLSPKEIQVANLIKKNKTSKEIGALLNLAKRTIDAHREGIRKKIGIKNKKVNLKNYLLSIK